MDAYFVHFRATSQSFSRTATPCVPRIKIAQHFTTIDHTHFLPVIKKYKEKVKTDVFMRDMHNLKKGMMKMFKLINFLTFMTHYEARWAEPISAMLMQHDSIRPQGWPRPKRPFCRCISPTEKTVTARISRPSSYLGIRITQTKQTRADF